MYKIFHSYIRSQSAKFKTNLQSAKLLNQSIPILMGIFIFFNPFPHTTTIKEICFYLSVFIVLVLVFLKKTEFSFKTPLSLPFGLFAFWAFLSIFFALDKENSVHDFYSHLLKYIILYYILINFFSSKKCLVGLSWIIIISATIFSIGGLFYYYFILDNSLSIRFASDLFTEIPTNLIGVITVFAIILSLHHFLTETYLYCKVILLICLFPLFAATFLTQARGTLIALPLAVILLFTKNKKALIALFGAILFVVAITPIKSRFTLDGIHVGIFHNIRININYITLEIIKDYPIIGIGFGMQTYRNSIDWDAYNERIPEKYRFTKSDKYLHRTTINDPHNMLFSVAVRVGLVGLGLFLYIIFMFSEMCWKSISYGKDDFIKSWGRCIASAFVVFFVIGIFEPVFSHTQEVVLYTIFSMITILWRLNKEVNPMTIDPHRTPKTS